MSSARDTFRTVIALGSCVALFACGAPPRWSPVRLAGELENAVFAETPVCERTRDNLLRVSLPLRNVSGEDVDLLVQLEFLDGGGNRYGDDTPREAFRLARGETRAYSTTSMWSKASTFVAHIARNR